MARQDMDIKGDVISELEDIIDPHFGTNILDALTVEELAIHKGEVDITLVYGRDRDSEARAALQSSIEDLLYDIEGVTKIRFITLNRSQMSYEVLGEVPAAPPAPSAPATDSSDSSPLSLSSLISQIDPDPEPSAGPQTARLYSGGGCSAGTADVAVSIETASPSATAEVAEGQWQIHVELEALKHRNRALEARIQALQNALHALIDEPI
jgi:metal-sulfur cluster biosynthetic enzyme